MVTTVHNQECIIQSHYSHSSNFMQEHITIMYDIHVSHCYFTRCVIYLGVHYTYISSFPFSIYIYIYIYIPYSGYFSRGNIFVKVVILAIGKYFVVARAVCVKTTPILGTHTRFVCKYFVVRLSTTKTTKILPLEKYPLYGI